MRITKACIAVIAAVTGFTVAAPAEAAAPRTVGNHTTPLDWCPGNASICLDTARLTTLPPATGVQMICWIDARTDGFGTGRWFYVNAKGHQGFVKAERVAYQVKTPWCLDGGDQQRRAIGASLQATGTSEYNQRRPTSADIGNARSVYGFSDWGGRTDWSGDCVMFVGLAWWRSHQRIHSSRGAATASAIARTYKLKGGTPPRGSAVFWDWGSAGHVAISLGDGRVVTTQGLDGDLLPTTSRTLAQVGAGKRYLGWTPTP